jgi:hypothetical protein
MFLKVLSHSHNGISETICFSCIYQTFDLTNDGSAISVDDGLPDMERGKPMQKRHQGEIFRLERVPSSRVLRSLIHRAPIGIPDNVSDPAIVENA